MAAVVLSAALVMPIHAHTVTELQQWEADWATRADVALTPALYAERDDMVSRHNWFFFPQPEEVTNDARHGQHVATPPSVGTGMGNGNVEQWRGLVAAYPLWDVDRMLRIMNCESGGSPTAYNGVTGVAGLFQIHPLWQKVWPGNYYDPATNVAVAYQVWLEQGYDAWVCR